MPYHQTAVRLISFKCDTWDECIEQVFQWLKSPTGDAEQEFDITIKEYQGSWLGVIIGGEL